MGQIKQHLPVKFFTALTYCASVDLSEVYQFLEKLFSTIEMKSEPFLFSRFTDYYQTEMGEQLFKQFIIFARVQSPEDLIFFKVETNKIEGQFCEKGKRRINLDPGYISEAKLVLATTKNYTHRIYLGQGIFGDVHLYFTKKSFQTQEWTYPDYKQESVIEFFNQVRLNYFHQLGAHADSLGTGEKRL